MTPAETTATIAAVSTPPGEGAIALVRLSGPQAIAVADAIFEKSFVIPAQRASPVLVPPPE